MRSLFDLFSKDPAKDWAPAGDARLTFYLASESLNSVAIDDAFDKLSVFGRPANRKPFDAQRFEFPHLGLEIGGDDGRVRYFSFSMESFSRGARPCEVTLIGERGTPVALDRNTSPGDVKSVLGEPAEQERRDGETSFRYGYRRLTLVFEFDEDKLLLFEAGLDGEV